jgi:pyroglutamyl-peptidase
MPPLRLVLTGFGPFPGVRHNASTILVERLAKEARHDFPSCHIEAHVLPVDWTRAPTRLSNLLAKSKPDVAIHFGVSHRAEGFVLEQKAYNEADVIADQAGSEPQSVCVIDGGRITRASTLPIKRIEARLLKAGLPVSLSTDPGRYLCNAVLYHSLAHARQGDQRFRSGFIHIPQGLCGSGPNKRDPMRGCALDWDSALVGGLEILRACVTTRR